MVSRWKVMSPDLREHPNYRYIDVVRADAFDAIVAELAGYKESHEKYCPSAARIAELEAAIRWALGEEGEFPDEPEPRGKYRHKYYWRIELRKRAALDRSGEHE